MKKLLFTVLFTLGIWIGTGCVTIDPKPVEVDAVSVGDFNRVAICVGLTSVDPYRYDGWDGDCPGCDVDAKGLYNLFASKGFTAKLILNSAARWNFVRSEIINISAGLKPGELLIIAMSGHGGQIKDDNGDEKDGLDETICMWDGQVRDDEVLKMIGQLPEGIRIVLINDQCHSEGNFRSMVRKVKNTVSFGRWGKNNAKPIIDIDAVQKWQRSSSWTGQIIQFAGCRESSYSYGSLTGGTWTQNLLGVYDSKLTWQQWFDGAKARMPGNQVPVWVEFGGVQDNFRNGPVLQ
jgi:hypothetical protein